MNSSEIVAKLRDKSAHSAEAFGCEEYLPMAQFWKSYADLSEAAASHIEAQDKLIEELRGRIVKLEVGYDKVHARAQKAEAIPQKDTP